MGGYLSRQIQNNSPDRLQNHVSVLKPFLLYITRKVLNPGQILYDLIDSHRLMYRIPHDAQAHNEAHSQMGRR